MLLLPRVFAPAGAPLRAGAAPGSVSPPANPPSPGGFLHRALREAAGEGRALGRLHIAGGNREFFGPSPYFSVSPSSLTVSRAQRPSVPYGGGGGGSASLRLPSPQPPRAGFGLLRPRACWKSEWLPSGPRRKPGGRNRPSQGAGSGAPHRCGFRFTRCCLGGEEGDREAAPPAPPCPGRGAAASTPAL